MRIPAPLAALRIERLGPSSGPQMARTLGISRSRLSRLESGESPPDARLLARYAAALCPAPGMRPPVREALARYWAGRVTWLRTRLAEAEANAYR